MQPQRFWGVVLLLLGGLLLIDRLGIWEIRLSALWPLLIFLPTLWLLVRSLIRRSTGWGELTFYLLVLAWSGTAAAFNLGLSPVSGSDVWRLGWPTLLVGIGLSLLLGRGERGAIWAVGNPHRIRTNIGDFRYGSRPWVFEHLEFDHAIGDVEVDLTTASIAPGDHRLVVRSLIGDVLIRLPADVDAEINAQVSMGDLEVLGERRSGIGGNLINRTDPAPNPGPEPKRIRIEASLRIGDVRIERIQR